MNRKSILMGIMLACGMLAANQGAADTTVSERYTMIIVDATGSMMVEHCVDGEGTLQDRFWCAKEDAKAGVFSLPDPLRYYGLYRLAGSMSDIVNFNDDDQTPRYFTNDREEILAGIDAVKPTGLSTPLADVVCDAMSYLQAAADDDSDKLYLHIYTDGGENQSFPETCGNYDEDHVNTFGFTLDAREEFDGLVVDNQDRHWVEDGSDITQEGRAYRRSSHEAEYDWAGGVEPGSWEWRVYYRTAWGDPRTVGDEENLEWSSTISQGDIITSITAFVEEVFPEDTATAASLFSAPSASDNVEAPRYYPARSASTSGAVLSSLPSTEDALFAGLAELTGGRYVKVQKGSRLPILGDLNLDGEVNETDMRALLTWFGRAVDRYNQCSIDADINLDGFVDNGDMMYVRYNWTDGSKAAPIMGDIDYNWCVDEGDLNQVMQWYGQAVNPNAQHSYHADMNADGYIDDEDVETVEAHMYEGCLNHAEPEAFCDDGEKNGAETDVDCGGSDCGSCQEGRSCNEDTDCATLNCREGVCEAEVAGDIVAALNIYTDWTSGYCANLSITNNNRVSTEFWTAVVNMNGGTIYTSWNGDFSGADGNVTVTPLPWNAVVDAAQTVSVSGFCAERNNGTTASVVSAVGGADLFEGR